MKEQLISFETAKLAKEKGFFIDCEHGFMVDEDGNLESKESWWIHLSDHYEKHLKESDFLYGRPTQSLLQKWLRDEHNIGISSDLWDYLGKKRLPTYQYNILKIDADSDYIKSHKPKAGTTYEEALEKGLKEALKLIKTL